MPEWMITAWSWILWILSSSFMQTLAATAVGAIVGAWAGSVASARVQYRMALRAERDRNVIVGRAAQYTLLRRYEFLVNIENQFIKDLRETPPDKLNATRFDHYWRGPRLELKELEFMIPRGGGESYHRLNHKSHQFDMLIAEMDQRNQFMRSITGDVRAGGTANVQVSRQLFEEITHWNNELIKSFDATKEGMVELMNELRVTLSRIYPDASFVKWEHVDKKDNGGSAAGMQPKT